MWDWVRKLHELRGGSGHAAGEGPDAIAIVTVTGCAGSTPCAVGAKMLVRLGGEFFGTIGGGHLEELALADAQACMVAETSKMFRYPLGAKAGQCCGGIVDTFVEVLGAAPRLYLFGVGHVGQALARILDGTAFQVHAIDARPEWIEHAALPLSVNRHACAWDEFVDGAAWDDERTYAAIMTHRHDVDQDIVNVLVDKPTKYVGLIGSHTKWARIRERLSARGISDEKLARVKCPIGIDIGGKAPQEVAVSIAAELLKTLHGR